MNVRVKLFAGARQLAGRDTLVVSLPVEATVAELRTAMAQCVPELKALLPQLMFAVDQEYADDDALISEGAEVACIPPVSGG